MAINPLTPDIGEDTFQEQYYNYPSIDYYNRLNSGVEFPAMIGQPQGIPPVPMASPPSFGDSPPQYMSQPGPYMMTQYDQPLGPDMQDDGMDESGGMSEEAPTIRDLAYANMAPESKPIIKAIETGYADKKFMGPAQEIREALQSRSDEGLEKAFLKLQKILNKNEMTWGQKFADNYLGTGIQARQAAMATKIAADIVASEFLRPTVEESVNLGFIQPQELIGRQTQPTYSHLIPQEPFAFTPGGEPVSSIRDSLVPAQPGQMASGRTIIPGAPLTPLQESAIATRLSMQAKAAARPVKPEKTDEFLLDVQARIAALGHPPTAQELSDIIRGARGQFEKEPEKGGLKAADLKAGTAGKKAETMKTEEQIITERVRRLPELEKLEAETSNLYASAREHLAKASDAVRKGEMAEWRAQIEAARANLLETRNQASALMMTLLELDMPKEKKVEVIDQIQKIMKTGIELSSSPGFMGIDMGKPNVGVKVGPPGSLVPTPPHAPSATPTQPMQIPQPMPQPLPQRLPPTPEEADKAARRIHEMKKQLGDLTMEEMRHYKDLRSRGLDLEQAMEEILNLRSRKKAK